MFKDKFKNKVVLVTGHTGFKGSWLSTWLSIMGAKVIGVSNIIPTEPSHFNIIKNYFHKDIREDIRNTDKIKELIADIQPDYVFHLAAQSLVKKSYTNPKLTWETNLMGTINLLEGLSKLTKKCTAILITSDKCYENVEWVWGYRETDKLGGSDPYSASKAAAEIAINSYIKSFFSSTNISIASARAGNVIGGGDWSDFRLIPDCVKAWSKNEKVLLRSPNSTRPWQHVLEPLGGYLTLASILNDDKKLHGESFNFGPSLNQNYTVLDVVKEIGKNWSSINFEIYQDSNDSFHECNLLKLNCDKALQYLNWKSCLEFEETIKFTSNWYKKYYENANIISELTKKQIEEYYQVFTNKNHIK
tara:strand:- start:3079 stop:4158 length:1080 start_codon:yes stop_codon:yes gene_type:complete